VTRLGQTGGIPGKEGQLAVFKKLTIVLLCLLFSQLAYADIPIYCPLDQKHLYNYQGDLVSGAMIHAKDFKPVGGVPEPIENSKMVCPFDFVPLNNYLYWFESRGYEVPRLAYPALSLLTKIDGEWTWVPDVVNLEE